MNLRAPRGVPLRPRRARRGDAPLRSRRPPDRDDPDVRRLGGRWRVQRRAGTSALLRPSHGDRHRVRRQPGRTAARGSDPPGWRRPVVRAAGGRTTVSVAEPATASTSSSAASAYEPHSAAPTAAARRRRNSNPATSTGSASSNDDGVRWFHCGGIFAALSASTAAVALEAMSAARRAGTVVSFDLNYRPSLWDAIGGTEAAAATNRRLVENVDVLLGNEEDFSAALGFELEGVDESHTNLDLGRLRAAARRGARRLPEPLARRDITPRSAHGDGQRLGWGLQHARTTSSSVPSCTDSRSSTAWAAATPSRPGLIFGLLEQSGIETALAYGVAHGALAMTTPGDTSMATLAEVRRVMRRRRGACRPLMRPAPRRTPPSLGPVRAPL